MLDHDLFDLSRKVVVLTGSSGFLGQQFAQGLCQKGATLIMVDINLKKSKALSTKLEKHYGVTFINYLSNLH